MPSLPTRRSRGPGPSTPWTTSYSAGRGAPLPPKEQLGITGRVIQLQLPPHLEGHQLHPHPGECGPEPGHFQPHRPGDPGLHLSKRAVPPGQPEQAAAGRGDPRLPVGGRAGGAAGGRLDRRPAGPGGRPAPASLHGRDRILLLRGSEGGALLGYVSYRYLSATQLFGALRDTGLADRIRLRSAGTTLLITSAAADSSDPLRDCLQLLMTEVLARALSDDCIYGLYRPYGAPPEPDLEGPADPAGLPVPGGDPSLWEVDMSAPTVLIQNLETTIQGAAVPESQGAGGHSAGAPAGFRRLSPSSIPGSWSSPCPPASSTNGCWR